MTKLLGRKQPTVADCINPSVELLRGIFRKVIRRMDGESSPNRVLWPEGKTYAVALSHDVDTEAGLRNVPLIAQMESKYGLRSSYNLVARGYPLDSGLLKELKSEGFELGLHGEVHDCRLPYLRRAEMIEAIERCRPFIEQYGVVGFRAPFLLRSEELYEVLGKYFQYDTSVPDVELYSLFTSNKGCGSVFPYFRKELCILPITLPLDGVLLLRGCSPEEILRIWMSKVEWIRRIGGLVLLDSHPEPYFGGSPSMMAIYEEFLAEISSDTSAWHALPREVSAWCKEG